MKNFGLTAFKNWQLDAIKTVINSKNTLVIQPTGSGKSLCFSFPPFANEKLSVVITPTVSLMVDQVKGLMEHGISAAHLGGGKKDFEVLPDLQSGKYSHICNAREVFYAKWSAIPAFHQLGNRWKDRPAGN